VSRRALAGALLAGLLGAGCVGDGGDAPERAAPSSTTTTTTAEVAEGGEPAAPPPAPELVWAPCDAAECATLAVPLDHDAPDGATIELALARLPATGDRIGPLLVNFGGPGSRTVEALAAFPWPQAIRARFDIVAVDPRGVGGSTPLACGLPAAELYALDHGVDDEAERQALLDASEAYARDCDERHGELLPHVGTVDVARDLDAVRAAMGDEQLSYLGYSYGTSIGQAYAERFPARVRAMVLDGIVDPALAGLDTAVQQADGFEVALARWADACDRRSTCPGPDPVAAVDAALAAAEDGVPAGERRLGPGQATIGLALALYAEALWPSLDAAVAGVLDGDGAPMLALADQYASLVEFPAYFAVSCLDARWPDDPAAVLAAAEEAGRRSPRFGEALVNDYLRCAVWPQPPDPLGPIAAEGAPPLLLVSTTGDPATPHAGALVVADRLASATLLTHEGDGHTIAFQGSGCVDDTVTSYLVDLEVPADGARC